MGTAVVEGELWGAKAQDWAERCEHVCRPLWESMLASAGVGAGTRLLDLGCGSGGASVLAAERGAEVSGFDASKNLLEIARRRVPDGDFRQGEIEDLPYADDSFDVVFAANSIQYVEDKLRALAEVRRVMSPEGRFAVGMWCEPDRCEMSPVFKAVMEIAPPPPNGPPTLSDRGNLLDLVQAAGFTVEQEGEVECLFEFESVDDFVTSNSSPGIMVGIARAVGEDRLRDTLRRAVAPLALSDGRIRLSNWFRYLVCR